MNLHLIPVLTAAAIFVGMLAALHVGRLLGHRRLQREGEAALSGFSAIEGAIFGVMGLLVAFTFSGAGARLDARRTQIVDEANAIGTAWLRLDLLPTAAQPALRDRFRRYVDTRIAAYRKLPDLDAALAEMAKAQRLQGEIWSAAVDACREAPTTAPSIVLLPALNTMFDITTTRYMARQMHPPTVIFVMLGAVVLVGALLAGYGMAARGRSSVHKFAFAVVLSITVWVILDLEFPRLGLIRIDDFDQAMVDARRAMGD